MKIDMREVGPQVLTCTNQWDCDCTSPGRGKPLASSLRAGPKEPPLHNTRQSEPKAYDEARCESEMSL